MRLPNKTTIGGMNALHQGNLNGNLTTDITLSPSNKITINHSHCVSAGKLVVIMCNFTVNSALAQWDVPFTIPNFPAYVGDYVIDKQLNFQITDNDAGTLMIKAIGSSGLAAGTYDLVCSFVIN